MFQPDDHRLEPYNRIMSAIRQADRDIRFVVDELPSLKVTPTLTRDATNAEAAINRVLVALLEVGKRY